jgi:c-di-GMP phosphodiesterase
VAEGIETQEQLAILENLACDFGQGFFFAKPLPVGELEGLLKVKVALTKETLVNY